MSFHIIPNVCGLKWNERLVLDALCYFANNESKKCWPSQATIAEWCNISVKLVRAGVKGLSEKGIITAKQTNRTMTYTITILLTGQVKNDQAKTRQGENDLSEQGENDLQTKLNELDKNLRIDKAKRKEEAGNSGRTPSMTVQVEDVLNREYETLKKEGKKIVQDSILIRRKMIKNSLTFFDNDIEWIKEYIKKGLSDDYVIKHFYSSIILFSRYTIQKYLLETKPRRYSEAAPEYVPSETDKMVQAMTDEERDAWRRQRKRELMEQRRNK